jgi:hypothetical protein
MAHVAKALSEGGINLEASGGETLGGEGGITLLPFDTDGTRKVLEDHNVAFEEVELFLVTLQDDLGALASVVERLGAAGVNIVCHVQLDRSHGQSDLGIAVDDPEKARSILSED